MEYLENNFAQIEHINQIIKNNCGRENSGDEDDTSSPHDSWDCFDTTELLRQFPQLGEYNSTEPEKSYIILPDNMRNIRGEYVKGHYLIRYNYIILSIEKIDENTFRYTFEIRNSLWDGAYKLTKTYKEEGSDEYAQFIEGEEYIVEKGYDEETNTENNNILIVTLTLNNANENGLRICFHMTMAGAGREILTTNLELKLESGDKYIHQFDKTVYEEGKVSLNNGSPAKNATVSIIPCNYAGRAITYDKNKVGAYIPPYEITGVKSSFKMPYGPTSVPGEYYCLMEAKSTINNVKPSQKKIIMVVKEQNEKAVIDWGDENQYKNVYKGCKYKYHINFKIQNKLGVDAEDSSKLKGLPVNFTFIHTGGKRETKSTTIEVDSEGKCYAEAIISYRGYYNDNSYLEVELDEIQGYGMVKGQKLITHPWYFAKTYNDLLGQFYLVNSYGEYVNEKGVKLGNGNNVSQAVPNDFGCDWIFLENGKHNISKTLYINRNVTIASPSGTGHSILDGNGSLNIIKTQSIDPSSTNLMKVNLIGLSFQHGECAINSGEGTRLLLERCYFTENQNNNQHHKGSSVFVADNDYNINHRGNWKTEIRNCYFKNNKGNEIQIVGDVRVVSSLFVTVESKWLQQPEVKVISILAGNAIYENNKSYINAGKKNMITNHSWAKALCYIGEKATFNGKGPAELNYYDKLPVFGSPWNNECYTYAIYWYDYGYNTTLCCCPKSGKERRCTAHVTSKRRFAWADGEKFPYWYNGRNGDINNYDPWKSSEIAIPSDIGIYNKSVGKFVDEYDPRFSNARSVTSKYD